MNIEWRCRFFDELTPSELYDIIQLRNDVFVVEQQCIFQDADGVDKQAEEIKNTVPSAKVERVGEGITVEFSNAVMFGFNSYALTSQADGTLNDLITILNKYPDTNIEVQGHTDSTGTFEYNQTLSENRAHAAAEYLRTHGIGSARITEKGYGKTAPKYPNATAEGRAQNRRVEFVISANEKMKNEAEQESKN